MSQTAGFFDPGLGHLATVPYSTGQVGNDTPIVSEAAGE